MLDLLPARGVRGFTLALICVLASWSVLADDPERSLRLDASSASMGDVAEPTPKRPAPRPSYANRFSSRVHFQMETMSAITETTGHGQNPQDHFLYAEMTQAIERDIRRTTRRAVRDYLLELTAVDQMVENFLSRSVGGIGGEGGASGRRAMDFSVGVSHLRPEVGMKYDLGGNKSFKVGVDSRGRVGLRYRDPRLGGNQVGFGFDGDDTFYVHWDIGGF